VPQSYRRLKEYLDARNIPFIAASARPFGNIQKLFENSLMPSGIVACDGAIIAAISNAAITYYVEMHISDQFALRIVKAIRCSGATPILFLTRRDGFKVVLEKHDQVIESGLALSDSTRPIIVASKNEIENIISTTKVRAVSAFGYRNTISLAYAKVVDLCGCLENIRIYNYSETRFGGGQFAWLDAVNSGNRKEEAIRVLLREHNVRNNEFAACGNGDNDTALLKDASVAFCPSNAVKNVRQVCRFVASCTEGNEFVQWVHTQLTKFPSEGWDADRNDHS
jgi:hydroxymethylpyrimidine pyrophosphatase-like HAD family hydrolase